MRRLFRFLGRLIGWTTLFSLIFWSVIAWHIVDVQPVSELPAGYPANVAACHSQWAGAISYSEVREEEARQCNKYYALMGDRTAPWLERLRAQVVIRLQSALIDEFMKHYKPAEGQQEITGEQVVNTLGTKRIAQMLLQVVTHASDPYAASDIAEARCRLEKVRSVPSAYDLAMVPVTCARSH